MLDTFTWIATLWTVIGGPAVGLWYRSHVAASGGVETYANRQGLLVGGAATVVIMLASYGLYSATGFPPVWNLFS